MARKPTMKDVARHAGVGLATIDRVLNERGETSVDVIRRVIDAARTLGLRRHLPDPYQRQLAFILPPPDTDFRRRLLGKLETYRNRLDRSIRVAIDFVDPGEPAQIASALAQVRADAVAFCYWGQGDRAVQEAVDHMRGRGVAVFGLMHRPPGLLCDGYFGSDNEAAGRTAAFLAKGRLEEGRRSALVLTPVLDSAGPNGRITGFVTALRQHVPGAEVVDVVETRNNPALVRATVRRVLRHHDSLGMIYNIGSGSEGLVESLRERRAEGSIFAVAHELTAETQALLREHLLAFVLDQNFSLTVGTAIHQMVRAVDGEPREAFVVHHTPFTIYCPENVGDAL